jgi:aryl-alcohol dehydrogenase-like predicted oxidoreductase
MLDTANVYADGRAESILGELTAGKRDQFLIASKVGMPSADAGDAAPLSPEAINRCVTASLRRLNTDYLDLYYLHQPDRATPVGETLTALDALVRAGTIRAVGVSNYAAWQIGQLIDTADRSGLVGPTVSQPLYNLLARRVETEYSEFSQQANLANVVYNPLAGGLLTGKHEFAVPEDDGRFGASGLGPMYRQRYWVKGLFEAVTAISAAGHDFGLSPIEVALRWLLSRPMVTSVLLGASSVAHLQGNVDAAAGPPLPTELVERLDEIWRVLDGPAPAYNR